MDSFSAMLTNSFCKDYCQFREQIASQTDLQGHCTMDTGQNGEHLLCSQTENSLDSNSSRYYVSVAKWQQQDIRAPLERPFCFPVENLPPAGAEGFQDENTIFSEVDSNAEVTNARPIQRDATCRSSELTNYHAVNSSQTDANIREEVAKTNCINSDSSYIACSDFLTNHQRTASIALFSSDAPPVMKYAIVLPTVPSHITLRKPFFRSSLAKLVAEVLLSTSIPQYAGKTSATYLYSVLSELNDRKKTPVLSRKTCPFVTNDYRIVLNSVLDTCQTSLSVDEQPEDYYRLSYLKQFHALPQSQCGHNEIEDNHRSSGRAQEESDVVLSPIVACKSNDPDMMSLTEKMHGDFNYETKTNGFDRIGERRFEMPRKILQDVTKALITESKGAEMDADVSLQVKSNKSVRNLDNLKRSFHVGDRERLDLHICEQNQLGSTFSCNLRKIDVQGLQTYTNCETDSSKTLFSDSSGWQNALKSSISFELSLPLISGDNENFLSDPDKELNTIDDSAVAGKTSLVNETVTVSEEGFGKVRMKVGDNVINNLSIVCDSSEKDKNLNVFENTDFHNNHSVHVMSSGPNSDAKKDQNDTAVLVFSAPKQLVKKAQHHLTADNHNKNITLETCAKSKVSRPMSGSNNRRILTSKIPFKTPYRTPPRHIIQSKCVNKASANACAGTKTCEQFSSSTPLKLTAAPLATSTPCKTKAHFQESVRDARKLVDTDNVQSKTMNFMSELQSFTYRSISARGKVPVKKYLAESSESALSTDDESPFLKAVDKKTLHFPDCPKDIYGTRNNKRETNDDDDLIKEYKKPKCLDAETDIILPMDDDYDLHNDFKRPKALEIKLKKPSTLVPLFDSKRNLCTAKGFSSAFRSKSGQPSLASKLLAANKCHRAVVVADGGLHKYIDSKILTARECQTMMNDVAAVNEVCFTLLYRDGSSQLRERGSTNLRGRMLVTGNEEATQVTALAFSITWKCGMEGADRGSPVVYSIPANKSSRDCQVYRELLQLLMEGRHRRVCFDAQEAVTFLVEHFKFTYMTVVSTWLLMDPKVAVWLLDADHPPITFKDTLEALQRHLQQDFKTCHVAEVLHNSNKSSIDSKQYRVMNHNQASVNDDRRSSLSKDIPSSLNNDKQKSPKENCETEASEVAECRLSEDLVMLSACMSDLQNLLSTTGQWPLFYSLEMKMVVSLAVMELRGIKVNSEVIASNAHILKKSTDELAKECQRVSASLVNLNSPQQLRALLYQTLGLDKGLTVPLTATGQKSTSEAALLMLVDRHPLPGLLLRHRCLNKLRSTFVDGIRTSVVNGYITPAWEQTVAATGRIQCRSPNLQALPRTPIVVGPKMELPDTFMNNCSPSFRCDTETQLTDKPGKGATRASASHSCVAVTVNARAALCAGVGTVLVSADFQQMELRLLAHFSQDKMLVQAFRTMADVFEHIAFLWLGDTSASARERCKRLVYAAMYGAGREKIAQTLRLSLPQAEEALSSFNRIVPGISSYRQMVLNRCRHDGFLTTLFRRRRHFPYINSDDYKLRSCAQRQAINFVIQGSAADLCKAAQVQIEAKLAHNSNLLANRSTSFGEVEGDKRNGLLLHIHDELVWQVPQHSVNEFIELLRSIMENTAGLCGPFASISVPMPVSVSTGQHWGDMALFKKRC